MKKLLRYKEYLPIIALLMYSFGYVYQKIFYSHYGIEIEYYISFSDLLFFTINFIVSIGFLLLITEIILTIPTIFPLPLILKIVYITKRKNYSSDDDFLKNEIQRRLDENYTGLSLIILTIILFFCIYIKYELAYIFSIYFCLFILKFHKLIKKWNPEDGKRNTGITLAELSTAMFLVIFLITLISFAFKDANDIKKNISSKQIQFCENEKQYSTTSQSDLVYIGETSNYLFLYNKQLKLSTVFDKNNIQNFIIIDPTVFTKDEQKEINNTKSIIKIFLTNSANL